MASKSSAVARSKSPGRFIKSQPKKGQASSGTSFGSKLQSAHSMLGELVPAHKEDARLLLIACFVVAYVTMIYGIYRIQEYESYTALYISTPLIFVSVWLIILAATRSLPSSAS